MNRGIIYRNKRMLIVLMMSFVMFIAAIPKTGLKAAEASEDYLCFTATAIDVEASGVKVVLGKNGNPDSIGLEYRVGEIGTWQEYTVNQEIYLNAVNDKVYFRAIDRNDKFSKDSKNYYRFNLKQGKADASGNIMSLLSSDCSATEVPEYGFYYLFDFASSCLTAAPQLPAVTLGAHCYERMFVGCTSLTSLPELPATELSDGCYKEMFCNCESATSAPELRAEIMKDNCYYGMFSGCSKLETAPALPAKKLAEGCYYEMFNNCTAITMPPALPATVLAKDCYCSMFSGCSKLSMFPALPAAELAEGCYRKMFFECSGSSLKNIIPALPADKLEKECYLYMFYTNSDIAMKATEDADNKYSFTIPIADNEGDNYQTYYMFSSNAVPAKSPSGVTWYAANVVYPILNDSSVAEKAEKHGYITVDKGYAKAGEDVTLKILAYPAEGWQYKGLTIKNVPGSTSGESNGNSYTISFIMPECNVTCEAEFEPSLEEQSITAKDVTAVYGDTEKYVRATTNGNGSLSYTISATHPEGADIIEVNAVTGLLTVKKAGTAYVTVTASQTLQYKEAKLDVKVKVNPKTVTENDIGWSSAPIVYNATVQVPSATVKNKVNASDEVNVKVTVNGNDGVVDAGTNYKAVAVSLTGASADNYQLSDLEISHYFNVSKAPVTIKGENKPSVSDITYGQQLQNSAITGGLALAVDGQTSISGTFQWKDGSLFPDGGENNCEINFIVTPNSEETKNYTSTSFTVKLKVNKADPVCILPVNLTAFVGQQLSEIDLSGGTASITKNGETDPIYVDGQFVWENPETVLPSEGEITYKAKFIPVDTNSIKSVDDIPVSVLVQKNNQAVRASDISLTIGESGIKINAEADGNAELSYAISAAHPEGADIIEVNSSTGLLTARKAGTAYVTIKASPTVEYNEAEKDVKVTVQPKTLTENDIEWSSDTFVYNGTEQAPSATVKNRVNASDEVNVVVTVNGNAGAVDAGTNYKAVAASLTGASADNYQLSGQEISHYFNVSKAPVTIKEENKPTVSDITYGQQLQNSAITGGIALAVDGQTSIPGTFQWKNSGLFPDVTDSGNTDYEIEFIVDSGSTANRNYASALFTVKLKVNKADPVCTPPEKLSAVVGQQLSDIEPVGGTAFISKNGSATPVNIEGQFVWENPDMVLQSAGTNTYSAKFIPTDLDNINSVENIAVTIPVQKKDQAVRASDISLTIGESGIKIKAEADGNAELNYVLTDGGNFVKVDAKTGELTAIEAGTAGIKIIALENDSYLGAEKEIKITVSKKEETNKQEKIVKQEETTSLAVSIIVPSSKSDGEPDNTADQGSKQNGKNTHRKTAISKGNCKIKNGKLTVPGTLMIDGEEVPVTTISADAFNKEKELKDAKLPDSIEIIGRRAFKNCVALESIEFGENLNSINKSAFYGCRNLASITLDDNLKEIGAYAFKGCKSLKEADLGNSVQTLGRSLFSGCVSVEKIVIPASVKYIGKHAFYNCKNLKKLVILTTTLNEKNLAKGAFDKVPKDMIIYVPASEIDRYKTLFRQKGLSRKVKIKEYDAGKKR